MNNYEYRPLDPEAHEIRILKVQRSSDESAPITLELRHASLDDKPPFNALSYTWGDETPMTQIAIRDGVTQGFVSVRRNLFEFLKEARQSTGEWSSEWVWIDQISINQDDQNERGHQVGQMRNLYSITRATLVWPWSWSNNSFEIAELSSAEPEVDPKELIWDTLKRRVLVEGYLRSDQVDSNPDDWSYEKDNSSGESLIDFFTHEHYIQCIGTPYWSRLWIIQEIVLARRWYIVLSGRLWRPDHFEWMIRATPGLIGRSFISYPDYLGFRAYDIYRRLYCFGAYRWRVDRMRGVQHKWLLGRPFSWDSILYLSKDTYCTEPLDRVYGVMGLIAENRHLSPDYSISEVELLRRVLSTVVSTTRSYNRWWDIYKILLVWRFSEFQSVGTQWDLSLAHYNRDMVYDEYLYRDRLDRHSRREIKRVVCLVLTELGIEPPPFTYRSTQLQFISPSLQDVISVPGGLWDYLRNEYHMRAHSKPRTFARVLRIRK